MIQRSKKFEKSITMKEIADMLGVSQPTVSAVLNNKVSCYASAETKKRIVETAERLGYRPNPNALALRGKPSGLIAVISCLKISQVNVDLLCEMNKLIWATGRQVLIADSGFNKKYELDLVQEMVLRNVDGIIINNENERDVLTKAIPERMPFVLINREGDRSDFTVDRIKGGYLATSHLLWHGHKRVGMLYNDIAHNAEKLMGYKKALAEKDIPFDESLLVDHSCLQKGKDPRISSLVDNGVTAFFAVNDDLALRLINKLNDMKFRVPDDIAVIGFDGSGFTEFTLPPITTISQPVGRLAELSVGALFSMIGNQKESAPLQVERIAPELVKRSSCGCKRHKQKKESR
ncbi:MAG TPA: hypothetical protein DET40_06365 [Lentisphaeria bacterium]|nr:MAG: hypothetical protein A2X45_17765 [Lentisphaerae bacterium GWF2_50_93]HCE43151.1 hypothetical protein [Lentisphaeria bacterium]